MKTAALFRCLGGLLACASALVAFHAPALAQSNWPDRPVKLVVPFPPGGGTDIVARAMGQGLSEKLGQPVIIDNKPGASTIIGTDAVAKAAPDGYTLLLSGSTSYSVNPALRAKLPYDPVRDLAPIAIVARTPLVLVVGAGTPWRSLPDLIAAAKAKPKSIRYATFGAGSGPHLAGELFALAAGIQLQDIPYKGSSQGSMAVIGGEIEIGLDTVAAVAPHVRSGKLRALAVSSKARSPTLPDLPAIGETYPGYVVSIWQGLFAPAGTPPEIVSKLRTEVQAVLRMPDIAQKLINAGSGEPSLISVEEFSAMIAEDYVRYGKVIKDTGIKVDN
jgi:tripartite-type tricarboxylate transporter receptor subunit TctC